MSNQVFEIVQAMSGQGNCITIPGPYLDFFAGDRQQHLLAAILNQLVFWSGKSTLENGWFYKEHAALAKEVRVVEGDVVRRAIYKITEQYLPGVIQEEVRQVNGTPKKHYRIVQEALMLKIFPSILETAQTPNGNGANAESYLYTDLKKTDLITDLKNRVGEVFPVDNFSEKHPEAVIFDAEKSLWGSAEDLEFSQWFYARVVELHERAAEFDGMISRPPEPNWTVWANEIRLLRNGQGCTHENMRTLIERVQSDSFWCKKIKTAMTLREKWHELAVKLCPVNLTTGGDAFRISKKLDNKIPKGFRG